MVNKKVAKCSMASGSAQVPRYEAKRILVKGEEESSRRNSKKRKVSEVKGNLQI